jgi:threonine synthase
LKAIGMGEGNTPVVESSYIGRELSVRLLFKLETCNPTGSYKDRFTAAQIGHLLARGVVSCMATSSGNTGAALAAYSARAGIRCSIFVNDSVPAGKLLQMQAYGAQVFRIKDFVTLPDVTRRVFARLQQISQQNSTPLIVSAYRYCPEGMAGVEKIAEELITQCDCTAHVFVPVGGGGLFTAVTRGFLKAGSRSLRIHAVQPEGCATVVSAYLENRDNIDPVTSTTKISGLAVPFDIDASIALKELRRSGGRGIAVSDDDIFAAQDLLLAREGIWTEPAGATALAGCITACKDGWIAKGETVVCLVTGHGFKDPDSLARAACHRPVALIEHSEITPDLMEVCS